MPSPQGPSHRAAQLSIEFTFGHDEPSAVACLIRMLTRAGAASGRLPEENITNITREVEQATQEEAANAAAANANAPGASRRGAETETTRPLDQKEQASS
jgi:hypothetical protein